MVLLLPNQPIIIIRTPPSHFLKEYQEGKTERCESKSPYITYDTPLPAAASFSWIPDPKERSSWGPGSTGSATEGTNGDKDRTRRTWTSDLSLNFTISSSPSFFSPRIYLAWTPRLFFFLTLALLPWVPFVRPDQKDKQSRTESIQSADLAKKNHKKVCLDVLQTT